MYFTVVIPSLNEENFIGDLLGDLELQSDRSFEVIVVDGRSTDQTQKKVKEIKRKYPLTLLEVHKRNVSYQRNIGAKQAKGEYLVFLDADARIEVQFLSRLRKFIDHSHGLFIMPNLYPQTKKSDLKGMFQVINFLAESFNLMGKPVCTSGSMIVEKNFFMRIGMFREDLYISEDHEIVKRALTWGVKPKFSNLIRIKYSLRRIDKEGWLTYIKKFTKGTFHVLLRGDVKKKIFEYEMGGHRYAARPQKK